MEGVVEDVVIVGGGIAGLATAAALRKVGIEALVLERSSELRAYGAALTLAANAWRALHVLGVSEKLLSKYTPITKARFTDIEKGATQEINFSGPNGVVKEGPKTVHRKALLEALAEEVPAGRIRFSSKLNSIETQTHQGSSVAVVHLDDGATIKAKVLIGCDGIHSIVARWLGLSEPVDSGRAAMRSLAVYPEGHKFDHEFRQFLGEGKRGGFVPLSGQDLYCFMVYKSHPKGKDNATHDAKLFQREIIENYAKDFPSTYHDIVQHSDLSTMSWGPLMYRRPWNVLFGKLHKDTATVAGDAMHPTTPDLGQGGCMALEDAVVLGRHIGESYLRNRKQVVPADMARAIRNYVEERRWRVTWVIAASFLSGWSQQGGSGWWSKFFRDEVFYKWIYPRIVRVSEYDCGKLPEISLFDSELDDSKKID